MRPFALLALAAPGLGGCALLDPAPPLADTRWELVELRPARVEIGGIRVAEPARYTLALEEGGMMRARLDCNRAQGSWDGTAWGTGAGTLRLRTFAVTRAFCADDGMAWRLEQALARVRHYELAGTELRMTSEAGGPSLVWRRAGP